MQAALPVRTSYRDSSEANRVLLHVQSRDAVRGVDGADLLPHNLNSANAGTYPDIFHNTTRPRTARLRTVCRDAHTEESSCSKEKKERKADSAYLVNRTLSRELRDAELDAQSRSIGRRAVYPIQHRQPHGNCIHMHDIAEPGYAADPPPQQTGATTTTCARRGMPKEGIHTWYILSHNDSIQTN